MATMASTVREKRTRGFRVDFRSAAGRLFSLYGFSYKPIANTVRDGIRQLQQLRRAGQRPTPELRKWLESTPTAWRAKLVQAGILEGWAIAESRPLSSHLIAFYHAIKSRGRADARRSVRRCITLLRGAGIQNLSDIGVGNVEQCLGELRRTKGAAADTWTKRKRYGGRRAFNAATYNHHVQVLRQLTHWLLVSGRADHDPLVNLKRLERARVRKECNCERRAATPEEMCKLLTAAKNGPVRSGVPGKVRALVYELATMSGLRASEIKSLAVRDFKLDTGRPIVSIRARSAKNATDADLDLRSDLAAQLLDHLAGKPPAAPAFKLPHASNFAKMLRFDLEAAGIDAIDEAGRTLDFHALRHTRGVWLFEHHGAGPREVQELMRVSTIALVDRYASSFRLRDRRVIESGPVLTTETGKGQVAGA
ncbi:MAG: site-specific integrase [Planctomycetes bacterium]|nr:site-specific integrase [Planctomycetota bacterium]